MSSSPRARALPPVYRIEPDCLYLTVNKRTGKVDRAALWGIGYSSKTHTCFTVKLDRPDLHAVVVTKERHDEWYGTPSPKSRPRGNRKVPK